MKKIFQQTLLAVSILLMIGSCKKEETKIYYEGGTDPVLSADRSSISLSNLTKNDHAVTLSWTNPNYSFTTGPNSQDVTYLVQLDVAGAGFSSPTKQEVSISKDLSLKWTVSELNTLLTKMELAPDVPHDIEMRVVSSIKGAVSRNSNVLTFNDVVPFEDFAVTPPVSGQLFIVGDATPGGWGNPVPANQELTALQKGIFEITLQLTGDKSYLFLPVNGSWSAKYGGLGANNTNNPAGDAFKPEGGDLKAPAASGNYKINVNFKTGKFIVTKI